MLAATGNINQPYQVIGLVHATASRTAKAAGCSGAGGFPIKEAYQAVSTALEEAAAASGADGVIHIGYDYRMSTATMGCGGNEPVFEVYGWGTAIKLGE
jgi:hypothetical protein